MSVRKEEKGLASRRVSRREWGRLWGCGGECEVVGAGEGGGGRSWSVVGSSIATAAEAMLRHWGWRTRGITRNVLVGVSR